MFSLRLLTNNLSPSSCVVMVMSYIYLSLLIDFTLFALHTCIITDQLAEPEFYHSIKNKSLLSH